MWIPNSQFLHTYIDTQNCEISMIKAAISRVFFLALHSIVIIFWKQWHQFMQRTSSRQWLPCRLNLIRMDTSKNELHHMKLQLLGIMDDWNMETIQRNLNVLCEIWKGAESFKLPTDWLKDYERTTRWWYHHQVLSSEIVILPTLG